MVSESLSAVLHAVTYTSDKDLSSAVTFVFHTRANVLSPRHMVMMR